jgi:hypothetical protein
MRSLNRLSRNVGAALLLAVLLLAAVSGVAGRAAPLPPADLPPQFMRGTMGADTSDGYARVILAFPAPTEVTTALNGRVLVVKAAKPVDADLRALTRRLGNYVSSIRRDADERTFYFALGVPLRVQRSVDDARTAIDLVPERYAGLPAPLGAAPAAGETQVATAPPAPMVAVAPEQAATPATALPRAATATPAGQGAVLRFPQATGHASAVFTRGETTWIVLDNHPALDTVTLLANLSDVATKAEAEQVGTASVIRVRFARPLVASVAEEDGALTVTFAPAGRAPRPARLVHAAASGLSALRADLPGAAAAIRLADPDAGDHILVVPARPGVGVGAARRYVEFEALPSVAGLAIVPYADDVTAAVTEAGIEVSRPEGLSLSISLALSGVRARM